MNFATFQAVGGTGTHFVTTGGQLPVGKIQQNVSSNGSLPQVVGMMGGVAVGENGVQYVRTLDGGAALQATPQIISVPIALPGSKPGDPQQTVQIQVLSPNLTLQPQQQPKYQMQIPIQGFQQGGAVLTVAYSPEANETNGIQFVGQSMAEAGLQVLAALPHEMQVMQPTQAQDKDHIQHQVFITPNQQIIINHLEDNKALNNNTSTNNNNAGITNIIIKEECDDGHNDDESSQGTETSECVPFQISDSNQDLRKYLSQLPPQQMQALPPSLQQFFKLNTIDDKKGLSLEIEVPMMDDKKEEPVAEAVLGEDGTLRIQSKKKKKYKKKPPKPARPKPGQVVITTTADGTPVYCCPECNMAYPEKELLEIHLVSHKIERRFICGLCGAGLKRKEHLERHKLGHNPERPYVCGVCRKGFKRREHLNLHTVIHSGVKTEMCKECGKGFYRKDHLRKHTRSHESKRARDEANSEGNSTADANIVNNVANITTVTNTNSILPEITIHMPTSANMQVPVQINIPQHVVSSLQAAQAQAQQQQQQQQLQLQQQQQESSADTQAQLEALLAQHS